MHKCDTKTKKRSPFYNSCASLRMSNNLKVGFERKENTKRSGKLEAIELNEAEIELIKAAQLRRIKKAGQLQLQTGK